MPSTDVLKQSPDTGKFVGRHIGPRSAAVAEMLARLGYQSLDDLTDAAVPKGIRLDGSLKLPEAMSEVEAVSNLQEWSQENEGFRSFIGMGYYETVTPAVVQRNVLEDPGWYTQYTPYQAEISQGRLEALLNFQTMVLDLTGMEVANASLLDEATAAAEAMTMVCAGLQWKRRVFLVSEDVHPQTIDVLMTRASWLEIDVQVLPDEALEPTEDVFGVLVQYPCSDGLIADHRHLIEKVHRQGAYAVFAADLLALTMLEAPGTLGADVVVGSAQRFGVPTGFGGPHAAFIAASESFKRRMPGRIVGVSIDTEGRTALRMALQTREQHIRREKATSNICTAQVLLAVISSMYAVYHGPEGLRHIAERVHRRTVFLADRLKKAGFRIRHMEFFDTLRIDLTPEAQTEVLARAAETRINLRVFEDHSVGLSIDEATSEEDIAALFSLFGVDDSFSGNQQPATAVPAALKRTTTYLEHPIFHKYRSETELLRYIVHLRNKDLSLTGGMIPLGSCTMKLNATSQMMSVTFPGFSRPHPFAPFEQVPGYARVISDLTTWLGEITGLPAVSLQPNSGAQGEYTGLLVIRAYHEARGEGHRDVCLIPSSAHGTNPASAVMAGLTVVIVTCDERGNIDVDDLRKKAKENRDRLAALMVTYPSTHGVFEDAIREICAVVHENGGQVYLDGANMNAQVGLCRPSEIGADVCHLNLHKTFAIPHGGGGPGVGPICAALHLGAFLPGHGVAGVGGEHAIGPVSAAPWGSAGILPISWAYLAMLGAEGAKRATQTAILNANYMANRLQDAYDILYRGRDGVVAHEFIIDFREIRKSVGITEEDVAKRLMDYGFHAPTMSWPVPGTMMIEPTESESKAELDRFCDALLAIREEIREVEYGIYDKDESVLKHAPHTAMDVCSDTWDRSYSREKAAYPVDGLRERKLWPPVSRIDNAYGDRHLVCSCPPVSEYSSS